MTTSEGALLDASVFGLVHIVSETLTLHSIEHRWYHPDFACSFRSIEQASKVFGFESRTRARLMLSDNEIRRPHNELLEELIPFHVCVECEDTLDDTGEPNSYMLCVMFPCPTRKIISRTLGTDDSPALLCPVCKREGTG